MGEIFEQVMPVRALPWTGERLTTETGGQVEIEHLHRYFVAREFCRNRDVLDIAAGEGYGSILLAGVARSVTGVEIDADAVRHAEAAYQHPNLRFLQGDARAIPLPDGSVDVVVSFETVEHLYEHDRFVGEIRRVLRPGGCLIISSPERDVYSPAGGMPNPHHVHELTRAEFNHLLRAHFRHVVLYGQRPFLGSALVPEEPVEAARPTLTYERRGGRLFEGSEGLPRPIYLVAIASDEPVAAIASSLYIESSGVEAIFSNLEAAGDEAQRLRVALETASAEVEQLRVRLQQQGEHVQSVEAELGRRDLQYADQVRRTEAAEDRAARRDRDLAELIREQGIATTAMTRMTARVVTAEDRAARRDRDMNELFREQSALANAVKEMAGRVVTAEATVQAMLSSTSWRISAPIRIGRRLAGRALRAVRHPRLAAASLARRLGLRGTPSVPASAQLLAPSPERRPVDVTPPKNFRLRRLAPAELPANAEPIRRGGTRRALIFGHVCPYPPRAGNEYRIHRLLHWLAAEDYELLLVLCPLPDEMPSSEDLAAAAAIYPNLVVLEDDGTIRHSVSSLGGLLDGLPSQLPDIASRLGEEAVPLSLSKPLKLSRGFCPDALAVLVEHLDQTFKPDLVVAEYVFQTRVFPLLRPSVRKVVDTHDVFSTKAEKLETFGLTDGLALSAEEESWLARRADLLLAIQPEEGAALSSLVPGERVASAGVDFPVRTDIAAPSAAPVILFVGSANPMNIAGLRDFLSFAWPRVRRHVPTAELRVIGAIASAFDDVPEGVTMLGTVQELVPHYAAARLVINPVTAGTGLKIKTVEALSNLRPVVAWPAGVDGLSAEARGYCTVVESWRLFAAGVVALLENDADAGRLHADRAAVARMFAPETVYASFKAALDAP